MSESYPEYTEDLTQNLHGETVGLVHTTPILVCDYCDATIETSDPVMYDAIRVADIPHLERVLDVPDEWVLDTARCRDCEIERLAPATEGYDEALCVVAIAEADGIQTVDASTLSVVDLSPSKDGYYPPSLELQTLLGTEDLGYARWIRMQAHLKHMESAAGAPPGAVETLRDILRRSDDIPPSIDV